jgi:hypothetical protein
MMKSAKVRCERMGFISTEQGILFQELGNLPDRSEIITG